MRTRWSGLSARVRPGHRVAVVNVSEGGALLEAQQPLRPGTSLELQFERSDERVRLAATVIRCGVSGLDPHRGPTYRAGVAFGQPFEWVRELTTRYGQQLPARHAPTDPRTRK
jgi:hypothetical protein